MVHKNNSNWKIRMKSILPHAALDARKSLDTKRWISFSFTKLCLQKQRKSFTSYLGHLLLTWLCFYYWQMLHRTDVAHMSEAASDLGHNKCLKCERTPKGDFGAFLLKQHLSKLFLAWLCNIIQQQTSAIFVLTDMAVNHNSAITELFAHLVSEQITH